MRGGSEEPSEWVVLFNSELPHTLGVSKRVLEDVILGIQSSNKGQIGQMTLVLGNQMLLSRPGRVEQAWKTLDRPSVKGGAETRGTPGGGCWRWELGTEELGRGKQVREGAEPD